MPALNLLRKAAEPRSTELPHVLAKIQSLARYILPRGSATNQAAQSHSLQARQGTVAIPTVYAGLNAGPSPGVVVGATLGAVAGFLLLVWLFSTLRNSRGGVVDEEVIVRRERSPRSRRSRRSEMRSVSRSPRQERVIRQERIVRETSRAPPPQVQRNTFIVDDRPERRVEGDDVVEVIEEHSSVAPRRKNRRSSGYRSVDPNLYAGGDYPQRSVY